MNTIKRQYVFVALAVLALLYLPGCNVAQTGANKQQKALHIINVNDKVLYDDAHIKGDIHIPFDKFENLDEETKNWNKESTLIVYCTDYTCTSSKMFAKELGKVGFKNVYVYTGGAAEWHALGKENTNYQMVGAQKQEYLKQPNEKIETTDPEIRVITAQQLLKLIQENA